MKVVRKVIHTLQRKYNKQKPATSFSTPSKLNTSTTNDDNNNSIHNNSNNSTSSPIDIDRLCCIELNGLIHGEDERIAVREILKQLQLPKAQHVSIYIYLSYYDTYS